MNAAGILIAILLCIIVLALALVGALAAQCESITEQLRDANNALTELRREVINERSRRMVQEVLGGDR